MFQPLYPLTEHLYVSQKTGPDSEGFIRIYLLKGLESYLSSDYLYFKKKFFKKSFQKENYDCNKLLRTKLTANSENIAICSLSEARYSIGSARQQRRRSSDYHRAHHPRTPTMSVHVPRPSYYRTPPSPYVRASKRMVQHQNSQAPLLYGYQCPH
ncbi:unnamed protein product [Rotaria socialis]|uniref:Uncharacterized protein n=1 Tax=Rotaria socialis TaxID=392032 RepID=A0A821FRT5_9BILA|nr:unnamed protein product [Rotaria socialis]CAF4826270.1 unnamed protein product [Rotaria socialis]